MNAKVRTYETQNNTYYIGYGRTAKTTYEQQQEQRARFILLALQKLSGVLLITLTAGVSYYTKEGMCLVVGLLIGLMLIFCNNLFN